MSVLQVFAILLGSASIAFLYYLGLFGRRRYASTKDSEQIFDDLTGRRLAKHVKRQHASRRRFFVAAALATLVGSVLLLLVHEFGRVATPDKLMPQGAITSPSANVVPDATPSPVAPPNPGKAPGEPQSSAVSVLWIAAAMGGLAMIVGAMILVFGPRLWIRLVGAGTLALGLTGNGYLVKEVKVSELFKFDTRIDKVALELQFQAKLKQLSEFGPEHLAAVENFESGKAELRPEMMTPIMKICQRWKEQGGRKQQGLLLITGSADRVPLAASIRRQYESNVGLARARAEQVRERVLQCGVPAAQIVTLVSGPRNTPAVQGGHPPAGFAEDRSVVVWALWSIPVRKSDFPAT